MPFSGYSVFRIFWFKIYPLIFCWLFWQKSENILSQPTKFWKSADSEFFQNNEIFCQNNKIFCQNTRFFSHGLNDFPTVEFFSHGLSFRFGLYFFFALLLMHFLNVAPCGKFPTKFSSGWNKLMINLWLIDNLFKKNSQN